MKTYAEQVALLQGEEVCTDAPRPTRERRTAVGMSARSEACAHTVLTARVSIALLSRRVNQLELHELDRRLDSLVSNQASSQGREICPKSAPPSGHTCVTRSRSPPLA